MSFITTFLTEFFSISNIYTFILVVHVFLQRRQNQTITFSTFCLHYIFYISYIHQSWSCIQSYIFNKFIITLFFSHVSYIYCFIKSEFDGNNDKSILPIWTRDNLIRTGEYKQFKVKGDRSCVISAYIFRLNSHLDNVKILTRYISIDSKPSLRLLYIRKTSNSETAQFLQLLNNFVQYWYSPSITQYVYNYTTIKYLNVPYDFSLTPFYTYFNKKINHP